MIELSNIYASWRDIMDNKSDQRTAGWPFMSGPFPTVALSISYIFIVKVLGPRLMRNRKAFDIERIQLLYNVLHLLINAYIFNETAVTQWFNGYSFRCQAADLSNTGTPKRIVAVSYLYFISKFTDYIETFIFVLGKRYDLVNFYHVAHHSIMPVSVWWGVKFLPGGHATFFGFLNSFVHIVIYSYLVLVTTVPKAKQYFKWWKSFLPIFQVMQFAIILIHAFQLILKNDCNFPMVFVYFIGGLGALFYCILMYELKWSKTSSKSTVKVASDETQRLTSNVNFTQPSRIARSKNFDIILNYSSFVKILGSEKKKTV